MKKHLLNSILALAVAAATAFSGTVTAFAGTGSSVGNGGDISTVHYYEDFESYGTGMVRNTTGSGDSPTITLPANRSMEDGTYEIVELNNNKVMKITEPASSSGRAGIKLAISDAEASVLNDCDYFVVKFDTKNGDNEANHFPMMTYLSHTRDSGDGLLRDPFGGIADFRHSMNNFDWNSFMYIGKNDGSRTLRMIVNGEAVAGNNGSFDMASDRLGNKAVEFFGLQIYNREKKNFDQVIYVDDMEIYGFNFDISCDLANSDSVVPTDTIALNVNGYIDEDSFDTITIASDRDTGIAISERNYDAERGILTLTLNKELDDFTGYTVDYSNVCAKVGGMKLGKKASFRTNGDIVLTSSVTVNGADRLTAGVNEVTLNAVNTTDTSAALCMIVEFIKDGKTVDMSYKNVVLPYNGSENLSVSYQSDDDRAVIKAYVKNTVNGTVYYGEEFTITKDGTTSTEPENITAKYPVVDSLKDSGFYSLILGEQGSRSKLETLEKEGLIDCTADVGAQESVLIAVVKKDGRLADVAYTKGIGVLHTVLNVEDKNSVVEMYVWSDIYGTDSRVEKAVLAAE